MKRSRRAVTEQLLARREERRSRNRRRWLLLAVLVVLLLLLMRLCSCEDPDEPEVVGEGVGASQPLSVAEAPEPVRSFEGTIDRKARPSFDSQPPKTLPWIGAFRLQVAARSPRLAECFVGMQRPGTLKWTAAVEPVEGTVSDHMLEPTLESDALTTAQRECVLAVLAEPRYRLEGADERARVSIVIEF